MDQNVVAVASAADGDDRSKFDLLEAALQATGFEDVLEMAREKSGKPSAEFQIIIKPNLAMFFKDKVTVTDPELVEHLVDRLHDAGYSNVVIGEAQNTFLSDNDSAIYDDGTVVFSRTGDRTHVRIMAHQSFVKPSAVKWIPLKYYPSLRHFLMGRGYRDYFNTTIEQLLPGRRRKIPGNGQVLGNRNRSLAGSPY